MSTESNTPPEPDELKRRDDAQFDHDIQSLIEDAEDTRLRYMKQHRQRHFITTTFTILFVLAGATGFGWFLLIKFQLLPAIASLLIAFLVLPLLHFWTKAPLKAYTNNYKSDFMPKMARVLGGLRYFPTRGINAKVIDRTGIMPAYAHYEAEDCFMGVYKGVKVLLSEARLYMDPKKSKAVFDGIFVLLEIPGDIIEGHTIISADYDLVQASAPSRWSKFKEVTIKTSEKSWDRFKIFSTKPDVATLFVGERLLKELAEAADVFDNAPLSAVLFAKKFIFIAIPYEENMFEAVDMNIPVTSRRHALRFKKEIDQILEIIDVYEIYQSGSDSKNTAF